MKKRRQLRILDILEHSNIETQEELQKQLIEDGFDVTQATVSRDIREMGVIKVADSKGRYCYRMNTERTIDVVNERLERIFADTARSINAAGNIVVVKSYVGMGGAMGAAVEAMNMAGVLGTLSGVDTMLIVVDTPERACQLKETLSAMIKAD